MITGFVWKLTTVRPAKLYRNIARRVSVCSGQLLPLLPYNCLPPRANGFFARKLSCCLRIRHLWMGCLPVAVAIYAEKSFTSSTNAGIATRAQPRERLFSPDVALSPTLLDRPHHGHDPNAEILCPQVRRFAFQVGERRMRRQTPMQQQVLSELSKFARHDWTARDAQEPRYGNTKP
jgi:hypothetical protein